MALEPENTGLIRSLFREGEFVDALSNFDRSQWIDVIIPVLHSNDLWKENLTSFYRQIPINRLLIGDAGCIDQTISIASQFPRVEIVDHRHLRTLGASIGDLIKRVETVKFAYLQSDVFLPEGWFTSMAAEALKFSWVGSPMQVVTMLDYRLNNSENRPLAGAQMGDAKIFKNLDEFIDDDFVYRQEEFVLEEYVRSRGGNIGNSKDTFHFHQVMRRNTIGMQMNVRHIDIKLSESAHETQRVRDTQFYGFLKYCNPNQIGVRDPAFAAFAAQGITSLTQFKAYWRFINENNPAWRKTLFQFAVKLIFLGSSVKLKNIVLGKRSAH